MDDDTKLIIALAMLLGVLGIIALAGMNKPREVIIMQNPQAGQDPSQDSGLGDEFITPTAGKPSNLAT